MINDQLSLCQNEQVVTLIAEMEAYSNEMRSQSFNHASAQEIKYITADRIDHFKDKLHNILNGEINVRKNT